MNFMNDFLSWAWERRRFSQLGAIAEPEQEEAGS
jgi:hypothetical protein